MNLIVGAVLGINNIPPQKSQTHNKFQMKRPKHKHNIINLSYFFMFSQVIQNCNVTCMVLD